MITKNKIPRYAVLLAAYNGVNWIEAQIESILNQENVDLEIFISIDLSTDGTRSFLEKKYITNNKIHILNDVEKFGGAAKNFYRLIRDVDFTNFDYISLADQDDIWNLDKLFNAHTSMNKYNCNAYSSNVQAFWDNGKEMLIDKAQDQTCCDYLFEAAGPGCTYVISLGLAIKLQEFIITKWEDVNKIELHDWLIYAFSRSHDYTWHIDKNASMRYRQHSLNQVGANRGISAKLKRFKMVKSRWYRAETIKIISILNIKAKYDFSPLLFNRSYINNIKLLFYVSKFRRKFKDKLFFLVMFLFDWY